MVVMHVVELDEQPESDQIIVLMLLGGLSMRNTALVDVGPLNTLAAQKFGEKWSYAVVST